MYRVTKAGKAHRGSRHGVQAPHLNTTRVNQIVHEAIIERVERALTVCPFGSRTLKYNVCCLLKVDRGLTQGSLLAQLGFHRPGQKR
jgi:hypothetical protein